MAIVLIISKLEKILKKDNYSHYSIDKNLGDGITIPRIVKTEKGTLYLPPTLQEINVNPKSRLIIIQHNLNSNSFQTDGPWNGNSTNLSYNQSKFDKADNTIAVKEVRQLNSVFFTDIFKFTDQLPLKLDIELEYSTHSMTIGEPFRSNHKIFELKARQVVRYLINGKADFTLTGRKQRTYYEFDYLFEWIGEIEKIDYYNLQKGKRLPAEEIKGYKVVNERKRLY